MLDLTDERNEEEKKKEETELFTKYYTEWKGGGDKDTSYTNIPRFYYRVITNTDLLLKYVFCYQLIHYFVHYSFQQKMKYFCKS